MRRRKAIGLTIGIGGGALVLGGTGAFGVQLATASLDTVGKVDFDRPLAIPPLAQSTDDPSGARVFDLEIQAGRTRFTDGPATDTWGVNGTFLGPTLRARRGQEIAFAVHNGLDEATSLHWHGMRLPAVMDGGPHQEVAPGETWTPQWTVDQPAATLWYHPHPHGKTAAHLLRGLAGMFIVDDDESEGLNLPQTYGVDDVPMIVQDRKFDGDNQFDDGATLFGALGVIGDHLLVNGTVGPYFDVTTRLVRLRLLNGSAARMYHFGFGDDRPFSLIATDGGLLPEAWETDRLQLSPGERAEIVVAFEPGETVDLRSFPTDIGGVMGRLDGFADKLDVCRFRAAESLADDTEIPAAMGAAPDLDLGAVAEERSFTLGEDAINGNPMAMERIDFGVRVDTVEVWEVVNDNGFLHNFHVHDVQFQVLEVAGEEPPPHLRGWKDTVPLIPGERNRLALRFSEYTDPNVPYMFHCHVLQHEDEGMMGQFVVLGDGEEVGAVAAAAHDHG
ncbi:multicopper oxidase family protein [Glycomyces harbinensis]|uniref:Multicopper oxidase with three cupredoxin domains (Includes cell division protein FtsP and spore coat protein CotA) n=1 Tax=Glycomyces harbinensis TaxID=58114 RepID=A0A1G6QZK1_9ACTN|nr:multicopper oxidase domain-containing protein [Glycomyces harbinensis]SDC97840.1 Multicopper oxidase with three cupredoxin domains (includes cell division protein FtsP and spore coat protein CotA) [Glycomyces harbinensis]